MRAAITQSAIHACGPWSARHGQAGAGGVVEVAVDVHDFATFALEQARSRKSVRTRQLRHVGEAGGGTAHGVGGRGDPLRHHRGGLLFDRALGIGDVPRGDLVAAMGARGDSGSGRRSWRPRDRYRAAARPSPRRRRAAPRLPPRVARGAPRHGGLVMTARSGEPTHEPFPGPGNPPVPQLEDDETTAPRPEEEIADRLRSEPDPDGRPHDG